MITPWNVQHASKRKHTLLVFITPHTVKKHLPPGTIQRSCHVWRCAKHVTTLFRTVPETRGDSSAVNVKFCLESHEKEKRRLWDIWKEKKDPKENGKEIILKLIHKINNYALQLGSSSAHFNSLIMHSPATLTSYKLVLEAQQTEARERVFLKKTHPYVN